MPKQRNFYSDTIYPQDHEYNAGLPTLKFWRPGMKPKDTDKKTGLETLPSTFDSWERIYHNSAADQVRHIIEAVRAAKEYGIELPKEVYDPKFLSAILFKEGRPDFGANEFDKNNDKAVDVYNTIGPRFGHTAGKFVAAMYDKGKTAERLKLPLPMVWNGASEVRNPVTKQLAASGKNYAERFPQFIKAAEHPKNAGVVNFVNDRLASNEYSTPLSFEQTRNIEDEYGNRKHKAYTDTNEKLKKSPLRDLQYTFFGGSNNMLGVPKEYDPEVARDSVPAPDFNELRKQLKPAYKAGGNVENTTHDRKII